MSKPVSGGSFIYSFNCIFVSGRLDSSEQSILTLPEELALVPFHVRAEMRWAMLIAVNIFPLAYLLGFEFVSNQFNIWAVWVWSLSPALLVYALDKNPNLFVLCLTIPFCWICAYLGAMPFLDAIEPMEIQKGERVSGRGRLIPHQIRSVNIGSTPERSGLSYRE